MAITEDEHAGTEFGSEADGKLEQVRSRGVPRRYLANQDIIYYRERLGVTFCGDAQPFIPAGTKRITGLCDILQCRKLFCQ